MSAWIISEQRRHLAAILECISSTDAWPPRRHELPSMNRLAMRSKCIQELYDVCLNDALQDRLLTLQHLAASGSRVQEEMNPYFSVIRELTRAEITHRGQVGVFEALRGAKNEVQDQGSAAKDDLQVQTFEEPVLGEEELLYGADDLEGDFEQAMED